MIMAPTRAPPLPDGCSPAEEDSTQSAQDTFFVGSPTSPQNTALTGRPPKTPASTKISEIRTLREQIRCEMEGLHNSRASSVCYRCMEAEHNRQLLRVVQSSVHARRRFSWVCACVCASAERERESAGKSRFSVSGERAFPPLRQTGLS